MFGSRAANLDVRRPGASLGGVVEYLSELGENGVVVGVLTPVTKVETVVEIGRVLPLGVLQDRLELVEALGETRFGRRSRLVLVPQFQYLRALCLRQGLE